MVSALLSKSVSVSATPLCTRTMAKVRGFPLSLLLRLSGTSITMVSFLAVWEMALRSVPIILKRLMSRYCPITNPLTPLFSPNAACTTALSALPTVSPISFMLRRNLMFVPFSTCSFSPSVKTMSASSSVLVEINSINSVLIYKIFDFIHVVRFIKVN